MNQLGKFAPWQPRVAFDSGGQTQGRTYQQSNSNSDTGPPSAIEGILKNITQGITNNYLQNPNAPGYYPGSTVAPFSGASSSAIGNLWDRGANGSPVSTAGDNTATSILSPGYLDISKNPYFQGAISYAQQPVIDAFNKQVLPGITSTFEGSGRTPEAGNLGGQAVQTAVDSLGRNLAGAATTAGASQFNTQQNNQIAALGQVPALAGQDYTNLNAMLQAGGMLDTKSQEMTDADVARYNYGATAQPNYMAQIAQLLQSAYPGGSTTGSGYGSGTSTPSTNPLASGIGGALGLGGLGLQAFGAAGPFGALGAFSDRRAKTDIEELGIDPLTGLKTYAYRYKGDSKSYPKVIGPMAQDVEERFPGSVREIGGHKVIMPAGGLI